MDELIPNLKPTRVDRSDFDRMYGEIADNFHAYLNLNGVDEALGRSLAKYVQAIGGGMHAARHEFDEKGGLFYADEVLPFAPSLYNAAKFFGPENGFDHDFNSNLMHFVGPAARINSVADTVADTAAESPGQVEFNGDQFELLGLEGEKKHQGQIEAVRAELSKLESLRGADKVLDVIFERLDEQLALKDPSALNLMLSADELALAEGLGAVDSGQFEGLVTAIHAIDAESFHQEALRKFYEAQSADQSNDIATIDDVQLSNLNDRLTKIYARFTPLISDDLLPSWQETSASNAKVTAELSQTPMQIERMGNGLDGSQVRLINENKRVKQSLLKGLTASVVKAAAPHEISTWPQMWKAESTVVQMNMGF